MPNLVDRRNTECEKLYRFVRKHLPSVAVTVVMERVEAK